MRRGPSPITLVAVAVVACECASTDAVAISLAGDEACAVVQRRAEGDDPEVDPTPPPELVCWGGDHGAPRPVLVGGPVTAVRIGDPRCGLDARGQLVCWGRGDRGQLGDGRAADRELAEPVAGLDPPSAFDVARFPTDGGFACAIHDGRVSCWGAGERGQLGDGAAVDRPLPLPIATLDEVSAIAIGGAHACALRRGEVWCWGAGDHGQLGDGTLDDRAIPLKVQGVDGATALALGEGHSCALVDGEARCWGRSEVGQAGVLLDVVLRPRPVAGATELAELRAGASHTCGLTAEGRPRCWGANERLQTGSANRLPQLTPVPVELVTRELALGRANTCAITAAGGLRCWGAASTGVLGGFAESGDDSAVPVVVAVP